MIANGYHTTHKTKGNYLELVGNTPVIQLPVTGLPHVNLFAKLELYNPTGSVKDRAAHYLLRALLSSGLVNKETEIIESSSGNYAVALAAYCQYYNLRFRCVIDPNITSYNYRMLNEFGACIDMITVPDKMGGYLESRLAHIDDLMAEGKNRYWINQYVNPLNAQAYYDTIGVEIASQLASIDYVFIGVSSGGTITGLSQKLKENYPNVKIIAVDSVGSAVFNSPPKTRFIPGIGSSRLPPIIHDALIDDVVWVEESVSALHCHELLREHFLFAGGSSGTIYAAVKQYFQDSHKLRSPNVLAIFPDGGIKYLDTIYNETWCFEKLGLSQRQVPKS